MRDNWSALKKLIWLHMVTGSSGTVTTVTGVSPLALANALSKPIKSLIQYGKVATVDGKLYCNNGELVAVDDELPEGYRRITGIKFDGNFYYDTGMTLTGDDEVTMTLANTSTGGQNVFGSYNGGNKPNFSLFIYGGGANNNSYFRYGTQLLRPRFGSNERTITLSGAGTIGFQTDASTRGPEEFETEATAYIGMLPNSSSPGYTGSIIESIADYNSATGDLRTWIPCEREEDGVIGYFDMLYYQFLEPIGEGTPVKGDYDQSHLNILQVIGAPESLSIGSQRAGVANLFSTGTVHDEQDIITGAVTHKTRIDVNEGQITITAIANPWPESKTPQPLSTAEGSNTVSVVSNVDPVTLSVEYTKAN